MIINFLTWNTQLYEYGNNIKNMDFKDIDYNICSEIFGYIKNHMKKENAIAVLQEIPLDCNRTNEIHEIFRMLCENFPEEEYDIKYNKNTSVRNQIKMTVVIAKKNLIKRDTLGIDETEDFCNCYFSFIVEPNLRVLAVHQKLEKDGYVLDKIREGYEPQIVLGDFNSGNYEKRNETEEFQENRKRYVDLLETKNYVDLCEGQITRKVQFSNGDIYETPIDHVLIKQSISNSGKELKIDDSIDLSDHYPISFIYEYDI